MCAICLGNLLVHRTRWDLACKLSSAYSCVLKKPAPENTSRQTDRARYWTRDERWKGSHNARPNSPVYNVRIKALWWKRTVARPRGDPGRVRCRRASVLVYSAAVCARVFACVQSSGSKNRWPLGGGGVVNMYI